MKQFNAYWKKPIFPADFLAAIKKSRNQLLVFSALLAALAAIFQSAGGFLPGVGFLISPFATLPVVVAACLSSTAGFFTYFLSIALLFVLQPSELFIFPFTTGLLGLAIGISIRLVKTRLPVVLFSGIILFGGISFVAFVLDFPIIGPVSDINTFLLMAILGFCLLYSFIWTELSGYFLRRLPSILKI
ncbi:hypothetical protein [Planomicrobium sp. Y74]|uniref:hypothetical protein n=1 Tax=Planomicrobium sp. Y74 TaxID=2478977 RepID=UPI000EF5073B|nr:hypothetical protein [Planomicrobium sp. Y74]RLQ91427.1 hypothetical protein D9754_06780 [Planomicrobium sp. Y74]